jgi:hypothetical protein
MSFALAQLTQIRAYKLLIIAMLSDILPKRLNASS